MWWSEQGLLLVLLHTPYYKRWETCSKRCSFSIPALIHHCLPIVWRHTFSFPAPSQVGLLTVRLQHPLAIIASVLAHSVTSRSSRSITTALSLVITTMGRRKTTTDAQRYIGLSYIGGPCLCCEGLQHSLRPRTMDASNTRMLLRRKRFLTENDTGVEADDGAYLDISDHEEDASNKQGSSWGDCHFCHDLVIVRSQKRSRSILLSVVPERSASS